MVSKKFFYGPNSFYIMAVFIMAIMFLLWLFYFCYIMAVFIMAIMASWLL